MRYFSELDPGELLAISGAWLGPQRPLFQGIPELSPLVPRVQEDHDALLAANGGPMAEVALADAKATTMTLDDEHDHLIRALDGYAEAAREKALAERPPNTARAAKIAAAMREVLPDGRKVVNLSNEAEVGRAQQMEQTLAKKPEVTSVLTSIVTDANETALDLTRRIISVAAQLGDAERRKTAAEEAVAQAIVKPSELRRRVRAWVDTGELVLNVLARSKAPADQVEAIRKPVFEAMETARTRRLAEEAAEKRKAAEEAEAEKKAKEEARAKKKAEEEAAKPASPATTTEKKDGG